MLGTIRCDRRSSHAGIRSTGCPVSARPISRQRWDTCRRIGECADTVPRTTERSLPPHLSRGSSKANSRDLMASGASLSQVGFRNHDRAVRCGRTSKKFAKFVQVIQRKGSATKVSRILLLWLAFTVSQTRGAMTFLTGRNRGRLAYPRYSASASLLVLTVVWIVLFSRAWNSENALEIHDVDSVLLRPSANTASHSHPREVHNPN